MADQEARKQFDAAVAAIKRSPDDFDRWDEIESLVETLDRPDEVRELYKQVLARELPMELEIELGQRAAAFTEEWFGDDPGAVRDLLIWVLDNTPDADWAFQRLTESFTLAENWNELLALYDRALTNNRDEERRIQLLDEAAQVAKDIANQPDKAISYLQKLVPLKPDDAQLEHSLERLLERHERWVDLIDLWQSKLPSLTQEERDASRVRIAACWLDNLSDPGKALEAVKPLLAEPREDDKAACEILERIVTFPGASVHVRHSALDLLRLHYESTNRPREIVRVLEAAIEISSPEESQSLREEAAARLAALEEDVAAMNHYAALLAFDPSLAAVQDRMFSLARRSGEFARYAAGVANAANECTDIPRKVALLAEAARIRLDMLEDEEGAIELFQAAMSQEGLPPEEEVRVARRLAELLARSDRHRERLAVLERLAQIEPTPATRKAVVGEAARSAERLGETDRALKLWQSRIDADPEDFFALDAIIALLESNKRWEPLIESLRLRVGKATSESQRRADLMRIATIYDRELHAPELAIAAWTRVQAECGENAETVDALADLLSRTNRWSALAELLERASGQEIKRVTERLVRLSDAYRAHLGAPDRALIGYRNALNIESTNEPARAGMTALLGVDGCSADAARALAESYRGSQEWPRFLELLEPRLGNARDARERLTILREAAEIQESRVYDAIGALASYARAFPLAPKDRVLEAQMVRLADVTGNWDVAARAYGEAADAMSGDPHEAARLRLEQGKILELRRDRMPDAYQAFRVVIGIEPGNLVAVQAVVRIGTRTGSWDEAARAAVAYIREVNAIEPGLLKEIEFVAGQSSAFADAARALSGALAGSELPARLAFELHRTIALWHRDRLGDTAGAEAAFLRALELDGTRADVLRDVASLQRSRPSRTFFQTLRRLSDADPKDLDVLKEAAEVALQHLGEPADKLTALTALLGRATAAWRGTSDAKGRSTPESYVHWAVERLVEHHVQTGQPSAAVDLLVDSSRLPFDADTRRAMRHRAARIASEQMRNNEVAIEMYRSVLSQAPDDAEAIQKLTELYDAEGRLAESLALKRIQLSVEKDANRRLALRLDVASLVGQIEKQGGRMESLKLNLQEMPGHLPSVEALGELLEARGEYAELLKLLEEQGRRLEEKDKTGAAGLWSKAAHVAETRTREPDRAIIAYRRVVELAPTAQALSSLANLYIQRGQPALAVPWLENFLAFAPRDQQATIVYQLAKAHLSAKQPDRAIACLESNIDDQTPAIELRTLLAELYRQAENWEALASLLTASLPLLADREQAIAYAREAADIYTAMLKSPNRAIPALEKALSLLPGDRVLRTQLGIGLRHAGRLDDARALFGELIEEFGRRRSPDRAIVHVELALVHQVLGDNEQALQEMETASKMDTSNVSIQKRLAELARQTGNLDKAERTYRSLLLVVRRKPPGEDIEAVGPSEVLYELHKLAEERGQAEQAKELLETALETAVQNDDEVRRLRRSLLAHNQAETLLRVIDMRLSSSEDSRSRAALLADKAEVLDAALGRTADALDALLQALKLEPLRDDLHKKARALSKRGPGVTTYTSAVVEIAEGMRRKEDPPIVSQLFMRAGDALEHDAQDLRGALQLYKKVEELGERRAEAYYAIARVAGAVGDTEEQARVLEAMLTLATADEPSHAQIDALYRLSEIFVANPDKRSQGVELLEQAFAAEPRYAQAGRILKVAAAADPRNTRVMSLYERVARAGNNWEMLLDFLERRAQLPDATPAQVREAVNVAVEHDQSQRAEALLFRAVEAARASDLGVGGAVWAVTGLAERLMVRGDLAGAKDLIYEIGGYAEPSEVNRLSLELARTAVRLDQKPLAAEMYELLREREPMNRRVWEPLVELYREMGDSQRLQAVIAATLPTLVDPAERNSLRMQHARYLIEKLAENREAIQVLRDVLLDDPDHLEAGALLEEVLRKEGDQEGLVDFLWQRFEEARGRGNPDTVTDVANRLGALLDSMGSSEAVAVYRAALEVAPESRELMHAVLDHLGPDADPRERAALMERLIVVEEPDTAAELASRLCSIWEDLEDADGYQRALELGHRASPDNASLHQRLEMWYRDNQQWLELARLMTNDADRLVQQAGGRPAAVARLREAASVYRDTLGDTRAAAEVLAHARTLEPGNDSLVAELAACLNAGGDTAGAIAAISQALDSDIKSKGRVDLLLLRSDLHLHLGQEVPAIQDLDEAHGIAPDRIRPQLIRVLDHRRVTAQQRGDLEAERTSTMRLAELLGAAGEHDQQRALLYQWIEREPNDLESLYLLRNMDKAMDNWEGVMSVCGRLVMLEHGEPQAQAAIDLAEAAELAGRPGDSQGSLEMVHRAQPQNELIRNRLRRIYELSGAYRELAAVLLADGEHAGDPALRYGSYRRAAEVLVFQLGDSAAAIEPSRKALELQPDNEEAIILYVDVLLASGRTDEGVAILEPAIAAQKRRTPHLAVLQQRMARVAGMLGDRDNQLGWLKKAFDVDRKNGEIAADLARLATDMGDYELALKPLRAITLMENPGPITRVMALLWEAKIEHARGNRAKAELWAKKALREDPDYADAKEFLAEISG